MKFPPRRYESAELFERVKAAAIADGAIKETKEYKFKEPYELFDDWDWGALTDQSEKFEREIADLIDRMMQWVGPAETRKILRKFAKAITKADIAKRRNSSNILERYDHMPNASVLARQLAKEGGGTKETALQRINTWRRKRKAAIAKGTWDGPPLWDRELNSYAHRKRMIRL